MTVRDASRERSAVRAEALVVSCPLCSAPVGHPCRATKDVHPERVRACGGDPERLKSSRLAPKRPRSTAASRGAGSVGHERRATRNYLAADPAPRERTEPRPFNYLFTVAELSGAPPLLPGSRQYDVQLKPDVTASTRISVSRAAYEIIEEAVRHAGGLETGGVLLGRWGPGWRDVTTASNPGPRAKRTANSLEVDAEWDLRWVAQEIAASHGQLTELGQWHLHPGGDREPSPQDLERSCGMVEVVGLNSFIDIIATHDNYEFGLAGWVTRAHETIGDYFVCEAAGVVVPRALNPQPFGCASRSQRQSR